MLNHFLQSPAGVVLVAAFSFVVGVCLGIRIDSYSKPTSEILQSLNRVEKKSEPSMKIDVFPGTDDLLTLSDKKFACNARLAFDHLSKLHARRIDLDEHKRKGDANLARIGTINRKATAAESAEGAFRGCLSMMMPELLELWEYKNRKGEITVRQWDNEKEKKIAGITFDLLEQTALQLENAKVNGI